MSPVTRIMCKTVFFAFRIIIKLLNIRLVFTKWMKNYLKLEFVLVIFTRRNLFRQFALAINACHALDWWCSTVLNHSTNVVIRVFPEAICLTNILEKQCLNMYTCTLYSNMLLLEECVVKYWCQCPWILKSWVIDPVSISCESIWPSNSG